MVTAGAQRGAALRDGRRPSARRGPGATAPGRVRAFTLLELVLVVTIVAALAGLALVRLGAVQADAEDGLVRSDLDAVRDAVRRFRRDTGYLPKTGPFALDSEPGGGIAAPPEGAAWFRSPANLSQLLERPDVRADHPLEHLERWDPQRGRGWNGPYLSGRLGRVVLGSDLQPDGSGLPTAGSPLPPMPALADPIRPEDRASTAPTYTLPDDAFAWLPRYATTEPASELRRPILYFHAPGDPALRPRDVARIVGLGPDGQYTPHTVADLQTGPVSLDSDDVGVFVLR